MSMNVSGEPRTQDVIESPRGALKCRIPQRLTQTRTRPGINSSSAPKPRLSNFMETSRQKYEVNNARPGAKNSNRPRSGENSRPKSANRAKEEAARQHPLMRTTKPGERTPVSPKRPPPFTKKEMRDIPPLNKAGGRPFIVIPPGQRSPIRAHVSKSPTYLPDQDTITNHEKLEMQRSELSVSVPRCNDYYEGESIGSHGDKIMQLKINWQEKMVQFEEMKNDLMDRQNGILELYALMRDTHQEMLLLGEKADLPTSEDLRIMNVGKLTPEQLLQLCAGDVNPNTALGNKQCIDGNNTPLNVDMKKLYDMPCKLVDTCEQTLVKRKEIIDWFEALKSNAKGISVHVLSKKINEFNDENDMLKCTLEKVKSEFHKELEDIVMMMRKGINETMALHLRTEELTYELSELNSQNADLKKQIQNFDHMRSHANKARVEELERELKEEKCKRVFLRERLSRTEGQVKINIERAAQLEAALEQARYQTRSLERTVQQLHDQNQNLQNDFDKELKKLTDSIKEHTVHLEEIAEAREKLQTEKEDLEIKLSELSLYYKESIKNLKQELALKVTKLIETEKKYEQEIEDKKRLEEKLESLNAQLLEAELRHNDAIKLIQEKDIQLEKAKDIQKELEATKRELESANIDINNNRNQLVKQNKELILLEQNFNDAVNMEKALKRDLGIKEEYINELEKKQSLLEKQLRENENKMESYVEQLASLKTHINQLQEDFGEFENLNELHEMVNQQRAKLIETTRQNDELVEALQKKDEELKRYNVTFSEHERSLLERDGVIKMLSEKEEEQTNIIKILRNNLELRSQAENELDQQIVEKNGEIECLVNNIETKKQQISNLEKIILTLEDQTRKASTQRKKDQEHIIMLQKKIAEFEEFHMETSRNNETPTENLDSLIKILEDELDTSMELELKTKDHGYQSVKTRKKYLDQRHEKTKYHETVIDSSTRHHSDPDTFPTKTPVGNIIRRTYLHGHEEQLIGDNLDRKKAITNMDTQKRVLPPETGFNVLAPPPPPPLQDNLPHLRRLSPGSQSPITFIRNVQYLSPEQLRDDKQHKMFKWAGHRL